MPQKELESVKKTLSDQQGRIKTLEDTVSAVLPPLLEKFDNNATEMHKLCISINDLVNQMSSNSKELVRFGNRMDKIEINFTDLKEEVIENRPLVKMVKGLGVKVFWLAGAIVVAAFAIIVATKQG